MDFCEKCKSVMLPVKKGSNNYLVCKSCGRMKKKNVKLKIESKTKHEKIKVIEKKGENLPVTHKLCPKCGRERAYWWIQQTRNIEEPPTQFFKCTKCSYTWREY